MTYTRTCDETQSLPVRILQVIGVDEKVDHAVVAERLGYADSDRKERDRVSRALLHLDRRGYLVRFPKPRVEMRGARYTYQRTNRPLILTEGGRMLDPRVWADKNVGGMVTTLSKPTACAGARPTTLAELIARETANVPPVEPCSVTLEPQPRRVKVTVTGKPSPRRSLRWRVWSAIRRTVRFVRRLLGLEVA